MLYHQLDQPTRPERVVVLGAGFIGGRAADLIEQAGAPTVRLGRRELDLLAGDAATRLTSVLRAGDSVVVTSALAPCKTNPVLLDNIRMMHAVCNGLQQVAVGHVVYISSDAVYRDSKNALNEESCAGPGTLHGAMHLVREQMLKDIVADRIAILRPTLVFGAGDPHNGYGPNRFWRLATQGQPIVLFGEGEERRDHVLVDDVADLVRRIVWQRSLGTLNAATGEAQSFREIAMLVAARIRPPPVVRTTSRQGPMPHDGYRAFDPAATYAAFPGFRYTSISTGLERMQRILGER